MVFFFTDPPKVIIRMGKSLVASDIREGVDVYFDCVIRANPAPKTKIVTWLHDVSALHFRRCIQSSEIRGLRSTKCSSETLQNLLYFMYKKTSVVFSIFHFVQLYFLTL